jgi:hypothetical protein
MRELARYRMSFAYLALASVRAPVSIVGGGGGWPATWRGTLSVILVFAWEQSLSLSAVQRRVQRDSSRCPIIPESGNTRHCCRFRRFTESAAAKIGSRGSDTCGRRSCNSSGSWPWDGPVNRRSVSVALTDRPSARLGNMTLRLQCSLIDN